MASHFILVEFLDPTVNAFLWRVRRILGGKVSSTPIHLTIRGPYDGERPSDALQVVRDVLRQDVFKIAGVGRFTNGSDQVVFFHVDSPHLRSVWWKPDYPIERYGFMPHISVYRGRDSNFASGIERFLAKENIQLLCAEHRIAWHESRQPNLFSPIVPTVGDMIDMDTSNRVDVTVLDRLQDFVGAYHQQDRSD